MQTHSHINTKPPIIYFGRLAASKGIDLFLRSIKLVVENDSRIVPNIWVVGGNNHEIAKIKESVKCASIVNELESKNLIFWWGHIPHEMLPYILAKCSIFCFTSQYEPGGRTLLEAMASGLPVIAKPHGFSRDIIRNGHNGYIVESNNERDWADKIELLLRNPEIRLKIGKEAKKTIVENYSMKDFFQKHWQCYSLFLP